nr:EOG090X0ALT [Daphnia pulex]
MTKYFLAEGAVQKNHLLSASLNENPWDLLNNLPSPVTEPKETDPLIENKEELKIAWRYENLTLEDNNQRTGNAFDLSIPYVIPETQRSNIAVWCGESTNNLQEKTGTLKNPNCLSLLSTVEETIKKWELDSGNSSNLLRITISSFGSPFWQFDETKIVCRTYRHVVVTEIHSALSQCSARGNNSTSTTKPLVSRSRKLADVVIQLKSLREDPHLRDLMDVHGILEMKKIMNLTSLKPIQDGTTTYGFKATKRKFKIEKLHLPPAVEDDKLAADNSSSMGCSSGSSKSNLDF